MAGEGDYNLAHGNSQSLTEKRKGTLTALILFFAGSLG
jgi:hypothetical protein